MICFLSLLLANQFSIGLRSQLIAFHFSVVQPKKSNSNHYTLGLFWFLKGHLSWLSVHSLSKSEKHLVKAIPIKMNKASSSLCVTWASWSFWFLQIKLLNLLFHFRLVPLSSALYSAILNCDVFENKVLRVRKAKIFVSWTGVRQTTINRIKLNLKMQN